jgi:PAS domain S-box-containing protein
VKKSRGNPPGGLELRRSAEERLGARKAREQPAPSPDSQRLIHELEVHQVELDMQNEELRTARQEIEAGLRRYTELFDFAPIGYFVVARDGSIRETNLAGARLLGTERPRLIGRPFVQFVAEPHQGAWTAYLDHVFSRLPEARASEPCDLGLRRSDATLLEAHLTAAALGGPVPTTLVAVEDVTGRKRDEAEVRDQSRHKDEFMAALSHELRTPLATIRNSISVLERAEPDGDPARKAKASIHRQVTHLTHIVDDLLDVTRIAHGKVRLQREPVELGDLVRQTLEDQRADFAANGICLSAHLASEPCWVDADPTRIAQVLGNLLGNALKFTPRGGRVEVVLRRTGASVALAVSDTGVGIAPELRARLFEPFRQAPQTLDRSRGGLGLGLAMVKGLVELHGGTIEIASDGIGCGSQFTVALPLVVGDVTPAKPPEAAHVAPRRVVVIEDNRDAADSLKEALEIAGHTVAVAYDGAAGLALARESRPDVVICDIGLPEMDGYGVASALRTDAGLRGLFLIALSGYALPEDLQRAAEAGFDRYIAKPPRLDLLEQLVREAQGPPSMPAG